MTDSNSNIQDNREIRSKIDSLNKKSWDMYLSDPEQTLKLSQEAENLAIEIDYPKGRGYSLLNKAWYFCDHHKYGRALEHFFKTKEIFEQIGDTEGMLKSFAGISGVNYYLGEYQTTLIYNEKAIETARAGNFIERELTATINTAQVYIKLEDYDQALSFAFMALETGKECISIEQKAILYKEIADIYIHFKDFQKSLEYIKTAYELAKSIYMPECIADVLSSMANILINLGFTKEAESSYFEALEVTSRRKEIILYQLAHFYYITGDREQALKYAKKSYKLSLKMNSQMYLMKNCELRAKIYSDKGQYKKSLEYTREFHTYEKKIHSDELEKIRENLSIKYKIEETKRENELNKEKNRALNVKNIELQEHQEVLSTLISIGRQLTATLNVENIKSLFLTNITKLMDTTTFGLAYFDREEKYIEYKVLFEDNRNLAPLGCHIDDTTSFAAWCIRNKDEIFISDYEKEYRNYIDQVNFTGIKTASLIFMPIQTTEKILGLITVQSPEKNAYTTLDVKILRILSSYIAIALENSRQHTKVRSLNYRLKQITEALWSEMEIAKKIQTVLLPQSPRLPGFAISAYMKCADEVGGDYYDVIHIDGKNWVLIGDVSGHGVTAGLVMMMVQTSINTLLLNDPGIKPSRLLSNINRTIKNNIEKLGTEKYMTLTAMALIEHNKFLISGLHQDMMIYRAQKNEVEVVETKGMWVGFIDDINGKNDDDYLEMESGDCLLLYTDGLTEAVLTHPGEKAEPLKKERFGNKQLQELLNRHAAGSPDTLKSAIIEKLKNYSCTDDVTFLILKKE